MKAPNTRRVRGAKACVIDPPSLVAEPVLILRPKGRATEDRDAPDARVPVDALAPLRHARSPEVGNYPWTAHRRWRGPTSKDCRNAPRALPPRDVALARAKGSVWVRAVGAAFRGLRHTAGHGVARHGRRAEAAWRCGTSLMSGMPNVRRRAHPCITTLRPRRIAIPTVWRYRVGTRLALGRLVRWTDHRGARIGSRRLFVHSILDRRAVGSGIALPAWPT